MLVKLIEEMSGRFDRLLLVNEHVLFAEPTGSLTAPAGLLANLRNECFFGGFGPLGILALSVLLVRDLVRGSHHKRHAAVLGVAAAAPNLHDALQRMVGRQQDVVHPQAWRDVLRELAPIRQRCKERADIFLPRLRVRERLAGATRNAFLFFEIRGSKDLRNRVFALMAGIRSMPAVLRSIRLGWRG